MNGLKSRLSLFIEKKQQQIQKGQQITEQKKAEKLRKQKQKITDMKPGSITTIRKGLLTHASPLDVMKEEYNRRKYEREHK